MFEQAYVAPHRHGESVLVFRPSHPREYTSDDPDEAVQLKQHAAHVYEYLFGVTADGAKIEKGHPRIVK